MKSRKTGICIVLMALLLCTAGGAFAQTMETGQLMRVSLQKRIPSTYGTTGTVIMNDIQQWKPGETAIIICDMWNQHWCKGATERVTEMAPAINNVITIARNKGALIVHAPSDCMDFYKDHPGRKLAKKYASKKAARLISEEKLDTEKGSAWPIDQSDEGCDDDVECKQFNPWKRQIDLIEIADNDAISDSGAEMAGLFAKKGIKNVILMGVHTNMCVIGRSFGLRNMVRLGMNVVLMRDLTDVMYDHKQWPKVSHFTGTSLVAEYIEANVCPSMLSSDLTGEKQFRFKQDARPVVAFIIAENEYHANETLPAFAHELLLEKNVTCEFALGKPVYTGEGIHNIENLQIMQDADLAVIQVRRRALPAEQMKLIKDYANSGKPIIGLRTASHAFNANQVVPNSGGGVAAASGKVAAFLDQWPEFDQEVIGGNYQGHYGQMATGTVFSFVPGMGGHPLLKGVSTASFTGPVVELHTLYQNSPLRSPNVQVLLTGKIPDKPEEPVLWINHRGKGTVLYTSLGHWEDWKNAQFHQVMFNAMDYLLKKP
ncbi:isochorismatase family protein [Flavihumibacter fluvii]|uniref:isochorismatase family protein n=1 Tax=Flavihumibacter fluvii TaxID=2838157 RepID=UPI001BDF0FF9|nr:isochorismatase family protein [Flavihumibacter fluvii]ULQ51061.1 isochorismatase family protein [Flavihumibacter fluvii]